MRGEPVNAEKVRNDGVGDADHSAAGVHAHFSREPLHGGMEIIDPDAWQGHGG